MGKCLTTLIDTQVTLRTITSSTLKLFHTGDCGFAGAPVLPGEFTCKETHVPIPNTNVKLTGPMIVPNSAKVGHCRVYLNHLDFDRGGFFMRAF